MLVNLQHFYMTELTEAILVQNFTCCTLFTAITVNDCDCLTHPPIPPDWRKDGCCSYHWQMVMCKKNFKTHQQCMSECFWIM